jgi:antitoxin MazE
MAVVKSIARWGNARALRIPGSMLEELGLHESSKVSLTIREGQLVITPVKDEGATLEELLQGTSRETFRVPDDSTWLDDEPVGKEVF